jgi:tetratricopeptide (TPR) repeat protein
VPVRVPFHLRRRPHPAPAAALLLAGDDPAALLAACARLAHPIVFPVAGGFLLVADAIPEVVPHAVRLRRLSENGYLPADADLVPTLRPAEAVDLTSGRGLVFLPARDPVTFDAARPLRPAAFLAVPKPRRADWEPFPAGHPPADRLTSLVREITTPPEELLMGDGPALGTEDPRPDQVNLGRRAVGRAAAGLGKGLGAIGKAVGSAKLGSLAGKLAGLGATLAPRLTEELLGRQEAALRRLLGKFRSGQTDDALRHAVPVLNDPGRGGGVYGSDKLPTHDLKWSLGGLFGGGRGGAVWAGGSPDTWNDLINEYRRAAQQAADRGDFRRAALIYAKLLTDYRAAAEVLSRGGLHRQAGILFRDKVRHPDRAAREFEKAGEHDEALRLYREANLFVDAGDLLRRLGEEEQAVAEYHKAADRAVELRHDFVEAGDLILQKTGRADLAVRYFARGWDERTSSLGTSRNATACAGRLVELYALGEDREPFWKVLGEAEEWLNEPGWAADAGRFFTTVVECAGLPHLAADRGELRDRARLGLALKVRQHAGSEPTAGTAVADLFGTPGHWSPAVVSDADFALRSALKRRPKGGRPPERAIVMERLRADEVTAAVQAPDSGDLFVGFKDGAVVHWCPEEGRSRLIHERGTLPVLGLAASADGRFVACLAGPEQPAGDHPVYPINLFQRRHRTYEDRARSHLTIPAPDWYGLLPLIDEPPAGPQVGVSTGSGVKWFGVPDMNAHAELGQSGPLPATLHLRLQVPDSTGGMSFTFQGGSVSWAGSKAFIGWMPESAPGATLAAPPLAWLVASPVDVELVGLYDKATLYWTEVERRPDRLGIQTVPFVAPGGFRAVALWRPGKVVGVTSTNRILWLRTRGTRFEEWALPTDLTMPARAVGCFPSRRTNEVLVVLDDGTLVRVPVPVA